MEFCVCIIGERCEPPSDKLGREIFISSPTLVCLSHITYGLTTNTVPSLPQPDPLPNATLRKGSGDTA